MENFVEQDFYIWLCTIQCEFQSVHDMLLSYTKAMMSPLYGHAWVGPIAIALIFPQLT